MGEKNLMTVAWMELISKQTKFTGLMETNQYSKEYGLTLSEEDAKVLLAETGHTLQEERRVEFGPGVMPQIICAFCDSTYISQEDYVQTLVRLQEIFFLYKNEMLDEITDDELLNFMKEQFETICCGDLDYLENTCPMIFSQAIRAGYQGYQRSCGMGEYNKFDEVERWDHELYLEALSDLLS